MAVAAVLSVLCAALIAMGAAKPGHRAAGNRRMPDVSPAVGTAAVIMVVTLIGAAALAVAFPLLTGRPRGMLGVLGIAALGGICGYGVRLVLQLDHHGYASGVYVPPAGFHEALRRTAFATAHGI
ncbi:hypothetical protein [Streptomyces sp. NBC_01244]|uniref:hypothetical protein n=1 Tax=Streptomyces sp. NBC_01244 TaxID=2903797 RepID=UPI002E1320CC|nr:hypothetical protein OG247_02885 [Streptomyces sp. NBC_01244]